jgi:glycosyltransferase involved in cell wall biosynthesis
VSDGLRILHCLRAPVGGLFRHVLDLARQQVERGHKVGLIADAAVSDTLTRAKFDSIEPLLALGLTLHPMGRKPGLSDVGAARVVSSIARKTKADVLHGHGAKGGAYARLAARWLKLGRFPIRAFYTPHGGTLNFDPQSVEGKVYLNLEKVLRSSTDGLIFESDYARQRYSACIGVGSCPVQVVPNGLTPDDFKTVTADRDADDFLFVGELRQLKGVDVLLKSLAALNQSRPVSATLVGDGPDAGTFKTMASSLGLDDQVTFPGAAPAHKVFTRGRCLVVPSRAESFPYIVLEAGACRLPLIATNVGGIPEMIQGTEVELIAPDDQDELTKAMQSFLDHPEVFTQRAKSFEKKIASTYTVARMTDDILDFYQHARR